MTAMKRAQETYPKLLKVWKKEMAIYEQVSEKARKQRKL